MFLRNHSFRRPHCKATVAAISLGYTVDPDDEEVRLKSRKKCPINARIDRFWVHDPDTLSEPFVIRCGDETGPVLFSVLPTSKASFNTRKDMEKATEGVRMALGSGLEDAVEMTLKSGSKWKKETPAGNGRGLINLGYGSADQCASGTYLFRVDGGHGTGSVMNIKRRTSVSGFSHCHQSAGWNLVQHLESEYRSKVMNRHDLLLERRAMPTNADAWNCAALVAKEAGSGGPPPQRPRKDCNAASASLANSLVTEIHMDQQNLPVESGDLCDAHMCITNNPDIVLVIHVPNAEGGYDAHLVRQRVGTVTYFRGESQPHGAMDAATWLDSIGRALCAGDEEEEAHLYDLLGLFCRTAQRSLDRIWISSFGRKSMYDLAWEYRKHSSLGIERQYHRVKTDPGNLKEARAGRKIHPRAILRDAGDWYGDKSPFM